MSMPEQSVTTRLGNHENQALFHYAVAIWFRDYAHSNGGKDVAYRKKMGVSAI